MLPRANRMWISDRHVLAAENSADQVRDECVRGPIAAANYVTSSGRTHSRLRLVVCINKERIAIRGRDQFRSRLAARIWIKTAQPVGLTIRLECLFILIALVACNDNYGAGSRAIAHHF